MPGWHEALQDAQERGQVQLVGVIQEQHPQRCRLFAQWKKLDWPILHDPINLLGLRAVPVPVAIDEHGVVQAVRPDVQEFRQSFLKRDFPAPAASPPRSKAARPDFAQLEKAARRATSSKAWRDFGDALVLWAGAGRLDEAVRAYQAALGQNKNDASLHFRLGVALRMRFESPHRQEGDFQAAVRHWEQALELDPNQYIYRRRIQQYGPRLIKPYPFYDWVEQARADIRARGETPVALPVEPSGAEIAHPSRQFSAQDEPAAEPDPTGKIQRDKERWIGLSATAAPSQVRPGETVRVHLQFDPSAEAHWNNEAEPLRVWIQPPPGWRVDPRLLSASQPREAETNERRALEFEAQAPTGADGDAVLPGYALYYVCEEQGGVCQFLRQDFQVSLPIKK